MQDLNRRVQQDHPIPEDHPQAVHTREVPAVVVLAVHQVLTLHHPEAAVAAVHLQPIRHLQGVALRAAQAVRTLAVAAEAEAVVAEEAAAAEEPDAGNNKNGMN